MMRQPENGKPALLLAVRAVKRAALADNGFGNRRAAAGAGLGGSAVHVVFLLEIAAFALAVHKIAQGAAAYFNRAVQDLFDGGS